MMPMINLLVGLIAIQHIGFLVLEMFLWQKPLGMRVFRQTPENAKTTQVLAQNQGLYNGFLAAGLVWSLMEASFFLSYQLKIFFLACVAIAGIFGAFTVSRRIFWIQAAPALLGLSILVYTTLDYL